MGSGPPEGWARPVTPPSAAPAADATAAEWQQWMAQQVDQVWAALGSLRADRTEERLRALAAEEVTRRISSFADEIHALIAPLQEFIDHARARQDEDGAIRAFMRQEMDRHAALEHQNEERRIADAKRDRVLSAVREAVDSFVRRSTSFAVVLMMWLITSRANGSGVIPAQVFWPLTLLLMGMLVLWNIYISIPRKPLSSVVGPAVLSASDHPAADHTSDHADGHDTHPQGGA